MTITEGAEMAKKVSKPTVKKTVKKAVASKITAAVKKNKPAVKKASSKKTPAVKKTAAVKKAAAPAKKAAVKKAVPAKKAVVKKVAPAKKAAPKKPAPAPVKKTAAKKAAPAPVKKAAVKKVAPAPVKKAAPAKAPVKKTAAVKPEKSPTAKKTTRIRKDEILKKLRLSKADKKFFYDLLMHARAAFGAQVQYHSDDALTRKDAAGERAGMATHMADLGTDNYRRDFELGLLSDGVDVLEMIDEALQRLEDSEYGICLDCGEPIPRKRLEAKPYAKYCTKCKSKREAMDETFYHRR